VGAALTAQEATSLPPRFLSMPLSPREDRLIMLALDVRVKGGRHGGLWCLALALDQASLKRHPVCVWEQGIHIAVAVAGKWGPACMHALQAPHLVMSPVVISRLSSRSTATAALLKMPPPPGTGWMPPPRHVLPASWDHACTPIRSRSHAAEGRWSSLRPPDRLGQPSPSCPSPACFPSLRRRRRRPLFWDQENRRKSQPSSLEALT
jgi:hypothetical protein